MSQVQIKILTVNDIPFAMELKNIAGWNQTEVDWKGYLSFESDGCFLAELNGEKAGTTTTIIYENHFGWIGMVLVHPSKRGLGIGTELLKKAIQYIEAYGVCCVKLDATPMGKKVYLPLGFLEEYDIQRYEKNVSASVNSIYKSELSRNVGCISKDVIEEIIVFDESCFGAKRQNVLNQLWRRNESFSLYTRDDHGITGYIMAHQGYEAVQIGPWVAADAETAENLFGALLSKFEDCKVFFDMPCPNIEGNHLAEKYGFQVQRGFCRMYLGENKFPGNPTNIYATSGAEKG